MSKSEDAADVRAYDEAKRRVASGEDELIPAEYANRILDGESPVRVFRELRGLSAKDLAAKVGTDVATLGQIEEGNPGERWVMEKIARALGVDLDDIEVVER